MAIETDFFVNVEPNFIPRHWKNIDEFEEYYLRRIQETTAEINYYTDRNGVKRKIEVISHHPDLKEYEVWREGYAATGEHSGASLVGKTFARNFAQACDIVMCKAHLAYIEASNAFKYKDYCPPYRWDYNPKELSDWGCKLYWSKELASKTFG